MCRPVFLITSNAMNLAKPSLKVGCGSSWSWRPVVKYVASAERAEVSDECHSTGHVTLQQHFCHFTVMDIPFRQTGLLCLLLAKIFGRMRPTLRRNSIYKLDVSAPETSMWTGVCLLQRASKDLFMKPSRQTQGTSTTFTTQSRTRTSMGIGLFLPLTSLRRKTF